MFEAITFIPKQSRIKQNSPFKTSYKSQAPNNNTWRFWRVLVCRARPQRKLTNSPRPFPHEPSHTHQQLNLHEMMNLEVAFHSVTAIVSPTGSSLSDPSAECPQCSCRVSCLWDEVPVLKATTFSKRLVKEPQQEQWLDLTVAFLLHGASPLLSRLPGTPLIPIVSSC